ncbi:MAG: hypothetical protein ACM33B_08275 [Pseudomonadota bacterium]
MSDERRRALNEAVARAANEVAEDVAGAWDPPADPLDIRCECSRADCGATLRVTLAEYEEVRSSATQFIVLAEHVDPTVDRVVGTVRGNALVEKIGREGVEVAEATDPRA